MKPSAAAGSGTLHRRIAGLAAALCIGALAGSPGAHGADWVFGQVAPYSGPLAPTGSDFGRGVRLAFEMENARGGIAGRSLRLVTRDDGYKAEETVRQANELVAAEHPLALIGFVGTGNLEALMKDGLLDREGIALIGVRTGAARQYNRYVFHARASYRDETAKMVEHVGTIGISRIAVFYQNDSFGQDGLAGVEEAAKPRGLSIVARGSYPKNTTDVAGAVTVIAAANPQAVMLVANTAASAAFIKALRAASCNAQLLITSVTDGEQLSKSLGSLARGVAIAQVMPNPYKSSLAITMEFKGALRTRAAHAIQDLRGNFTTLEGYIAAKVLIDAMKHAGHNLSRETLVSALEREGTIELGGFTLSFGPHQHEGSRFVELSVIGADGKLIQ